MSSTEQESSNSSGTSDDIKNDSLVNLMNGKNRNNSSNGNKKSPVKQQISSSLQQQQNRCTWCAETKQPLKYVLPTQNGKKEFCSESCIAEFRKAYNKGACKECDNAIRGNAPNRDFCSTYCLNKNSKKKGGTLTSTPSTSQTIKMVNNNNNNSIENINSKQKSLTPATTTSSTTSAVEANNNNALIKEHYAVTKISPMFQYEAFHVFDWNEYLKVNEAKFLVNLI